MCYEIGRNLDGKVCVRMWESGLVAQTEMRDVPCWWTTITGKEISVVALPQGGGKLYPAAALDWIFISSVNKPAQLPRSK